MDVFTDGTRALFAAVVSTFLLAWFVLAFTGWLAYTLKRLTGG